MGVNKTRFGLVLIFVALIASIVSLFYWDFVRETVVVPIYFLLWLIDLVIKSVPQQAYLAVLALICLIMGFNTLQRISGGQPTPSRPRIQTTDITRYTHWRRVYRNLYGNSFFRNEFGTEIRKLLLAVLAYQEGLSTAQIETMILNGTLSVPPAVTDLIRQRGFILPAAPRTNTIQRVGQRLSRLLFYKPSQMPIQDDERVAEVIHFIEHRLEIVHARQQSES
jgi:hypothetical protein